MSLKQKATAAATRANRGSGSPRLIQAVAREYLAWINSKANRVAAGAALDAASSGVEILPRSVLRDAEALYADYADDPASDVEALTRGEAAGIYPSMVNLAGYAQADGSDQSANIQSALTAAQGGTLFVPKGTWTRSATLNVPQGTRVVFAGRGAVFRYTGSGSAVKVSNGKNIDLTNLTVNLSAAGPSAVGLHLAGAWHVNIDAPTIVQGGATSTGILIETSANATNFGAYCIRIADPDMQAGAGSYGIRAMQTAGDTNRVTHLYIEGGWIAGKKFGAHFDRVDDGRIIDTTFEGGAGTTNGIYLMNASYFVLNPGEIALYDGWGIDFGAGNARIMVLAPTRSSPGGALGFVNTATYGPSFLDYERTRVYGSASDPTFWAELISKFDYGQAVALRAAGGGGAVDLLTWGEAAGLVASGGPAGVTVGKAAEKVGFYGKAPVLRPVLGYSRATESGPEFELRTALAALGLVTDNTTA